MMAVEGKRASNRSQDVLKERCGKSLLQKPRKKQGDLGPGGERGEKNFLKFILKEIYGIVRGEEKESLLLRKWSKRIKERKRRHGLIYRECTRNQIIYFR